MRIDTKAPVFYEQSIEVNANPQKIWQVMSNIEEWPSWNRDISYAKLEGELKKGNIFKWKSGPGSITSTLEVVQEPYLIGWSGKLFGIKAVHVWKIEVKNGKSLVTTKESWSGLIASIFRKSSKKTLVKAIDTGLKQLKATAEV